MPQDGDHVFVTQWLRDYLSELLDRHWCVNTQAPVTLSNSEPEPDCAVLRGNRAHFRGRKPLGKEVALVIEVADTLRRDRWKKGIYARAGISMYWIVNLEQSCVEVYSQPVKSKQDYKSTRIFQADEPVPLILDGKELASVPFKSVLP
jgi:Uma2 family endonuclease